MFVRGSFPRWMGTKANGAIPVVTKEELEKLIQAKGDADPAGEADVLLLDVREVNEMQATGMIPSAKAMPLTQVQQALQLDDEEFLATFSFPKSLLKEKRVVCYCRAGVRSHNAAVLLQEYGAKDVSNYKGSFLEWFPDRFY